MDLLKGAGRRIRDDESGHAMVGVPSLIGAIGAVLLAVGAAGSNCASSGPPRRRSRCALRRSSDGRGRLLGSAVVVVSSPSGCRSYPYEGHTSDATRSRAFPLPARVQAAPTPLDKCARTTIIGDGFKRSAFRSLILSIN